MDIMVYLPEEVGTWAKEAGINFSATLRQALIERRAQTGAVEATLADSGVHEVTVDADGRAYTARISGTIIASNDRTGDLVFLTEDEQVILYEERKERLHYLQDGEIDEVLRGFLDDGEYIDAMNALGLDPVIEIGGKG